MFSGFESSWYHGPALFPYKKAQIMIKIKGMFQQKESRVIYNRNTVSLYSYAEHDRWFVLVHGKAWSNKPSTSPLTAVSVNHCPGWGHPEWIGSTARCDQFLKVVSASYIWLAWCQSAIAAANLNDSCHTTEIFSDLLNSCILALLGASVLSLIGDPKCNFPVVAKSENNPPSYTWSPAHIPESTLHIWGRL